MELTATRPAGTETNYYKEHSNNAQDISMGSRLGRMCASQDDVEARLARLLTQAGGAGFKAGAAARRTLVSERRLARIVPRAACLDLAPRRPSRTGHTCASARTRVPTSFEPGDPLTAPAQSLDSIDR